MSRYIDAEALIKLHESKEGFPWFECVRFNRLAKRIDEAPHIDIVRCKECKYEPICSHSVQHTTHEPTSVTIGYKSVDYCSYGEREGE